jgi:hypothetical protein
LKYILALSAKNYAQNISNKMFYNNQNKQTLETNIHVSETRIPSTFSPISKHSYNKRV